MGFDMRSFCDACGRFRNTLPFGDPSDFFDRNRGPCGKCGEPGPGQQVIARSVRAGKWTLKRIWVDREGNRVDVPKKVPNG